MPAIQGDWVEVENTVLNPEERLDNLPASTKKAPLKMWVRGFLQAVSADVGDQVKVKTLTGRKMCIRDSTQTAYFVKQQVINAAVVDMVQRQYTPHVFLSCLVEGCKMCIRDRPYRMRGLMNLD